MKTKTLLLSGVLMVIGGAAMAQPPKAALPSKADKMKADLFIAVTRQRPADVKAVLKRGADPNARNWLTLTPLMWASIRGNQEIVDLLLQRGARINDTCIIGSPLTMAELGRNEKIALTLLSKGASLKTARIDKATALMFAAANGHTTLLDRLIKKGSDPNAQDVDGATALMWAARQGQNNAVESLLRAKANVNLADKHGRTPLMYAAMNSHPQVVETLLKHGANVQAKDTKGATALLLTARYSGHAAIIRSLIERGADVSAKDAAGQTALSLVRDRGYQEVEKFMRETAPVTVELPAPRTLSVKRAVENSLTTLQAGMRTFNRSIACTSCHHQGLGLMALGRAGQRGFEVDKTVIGDYMKQAQKDGQAGAALIHQALTDKSVFGLLPPADIGDFPITFGYILPALHANGVPQNPGLAEVALLLADQQEAEGHWNFALQREPMQSSYLTTTALTLEALNAYLPQAKRPALAARYARSKRWLLSTPAPNVEDKAARLLGLKAVGATAEECAKSVQELRAAQRPDGGWAQLPALNSDAYATGIALYALRVAGGLAASDPMIQRGVQYLLRTQDEDGSWYVNKRTLPANSYYDGGFPHGESQYSSFAGTCWAILALLEAEEPKQVAQK